MSLLDVEGVDAHHGQLQALFGVTLQVDEGETVAIIGANGAGKSTLLRAVAGITPVSSGTISFDGVRIDGERPHRRVGRGIAMTPEGRRLFASLSVEENLVVGGHARRPGPWTVPKVLAVLPLLEPLMRRSAGTLSGGEQQATAIGRALLSNPRLLLLDEVSLGLAPVVIAGLYATLPAIVAAGTTVVVVEQDTGEALTIADRAYCMLEGRMVLEGRPADLTTAQITAAYFGTERIGQR